MKRSLLLLLLAVFFLPAAPVFAAADGAKEVQAAKEEVRKPVTISEGSQLPLRVLTRANSALYKGPDQDVAQGNLPTFALYFVYTRPSDKDRAEEKGWYEVGTDDRGTVVGWLKAADVFEWKQTMIVSYTHPEGRKPVLMFDSKEFLDKLIGKEPTARATEAAGLHKTIDSGSIPKDFPVVSVEPKMAVDFQKEFYLFPILDFEARTIDGREGRLLKVVAVGAGADAREKTDIRENKTYVAEAIKTSAEAATAETTKDLKFDIVWVIDATKSMQPFIDGTKDVVRNASQLLAKKAAVADSLKFGLWAYRDPPDEIPGIEFLTKNFTPDLQKIDAFEKSIADLRQTEVDSVDYPEDVFSGVNDAITKTKWTEGAERVIILVGDAPSHEKEHKWNKSGLDEESLRALLTEKKVTLIDIQLRPKGAKSFQTVQEKQFKALAQNPGADKAPYYSVPAADLPEFAKSTEKIVGTIAALLESAQAGTLDKKLEAGGQVAVVPVSGGEAAALQEDNDKATPSAPTAPAPPAKEEAVATAPAASAPKANEPAPAAPAGGEAAALADGNEQTVNAKADAGLSQSLKAAVVRWLGSETGAKPPRDVTAWVTDKDMNDSSRASLEVRLLISKRQLDGLATLLNDLIKAGKTGQLNEEDFFTALQAASATAARDPERIKNAESLAQSGLVPDFLNGLPYQSKIMVLSNEMWSGMSADDQDNFLRELESKIKAYKALHDQPEGWIRLNQGADADESVYPIPLSLLP